MLISIFIGILFLAFSNTFLVMRFTSNKSVFKNLYFSRLSLVGFIIILLSSYLSLLINVETWLLLFIYTAVTSIILILLTWFIGMNNYQRVLILNTLKKIKK